MDLYAQIMPERAVAVGAFLPELRSAPITGRIESLQSLRAIAALLVLFQHVAQAPAPAISAAGVLLRQHFAPFGSAGVDLFFVISGFVIAHSISSARAASPAAFLLGRALRILPLFWLMSLVYAWEILSAHKTIAPAIWINTLTLVPLTGRPEFIYPLLPVGWSLGFELAFYAIAALMLTQRKVLRVPLLLIVLPGLALAGAVTGAPIVVLNAMMIEFALGAAAWMVWKFGLSAPTAACLFVVGFALFVSGLIVNVGQGFETDPALIIANVTSLRRSIVWGIPAAIMLTGIVASIGEGGWTLTRIGDASFSLYLVHPIVLFHIERMHLRNYVTSYALFVAILFAVSIGAALVTHAWVEKPFMRWAKQCAATLDRAHKKGGHRIR